MGAAVITIDNLIEHLDEMTNDRGFTEFSFAGIEALGPKAALIQYGEQQVWFPYSQLRYLDDDIYVTEWILEQKGLA